MPWFEQNADLPANNGATGRFNGATPDANTLASLVAPLNNHSVTPAQWRLSIHRQTNPLVFITC